MELLPSYRIVRWLFPAGEYYIGDPCYVVPDKEWLPLLERTGYFGNHFSPEYTDGLFLYKGQHAFAHSTRYGDGCYDLNGAGSSEFNMIGVDAGLISVIPLKTIDASKMEYALGLGQKIKMGLDFWVWYEDGVFHIGHFTIDTK